jgi:hypothetical protein
MKAGPLGIYYLDYCDVPFPKSRRKMIMGYTRSNFLQYMAEAKIPDNYYCWLQECRTPGYLIEGTAEIVRDWIDKHMKENFGEPYEP